MRSFKDTLVVLALVAAVAVAGAAVVGPIAASAENASCTEAARAALVATPADTTSRDPEAAVRYYMLPERRAMIQGLVDCVGGDLQQRMISGDIPYVKDFDDPNGYDYVQTDREIAGSDAPIIEMLVNFVDGKIDATTKPRYFDLHEKDLGVLVAGESVEDGKGGFVENTPRSYQWSITRVDLPATNSNAFANVLSMDIVREHAEGFERYLDERTPIDPNGGPYAIELRRDNNPWGVTATVDSVREADRELIDTLANMGY